MKCIKKKPFIKRKKSYKIYLLILYQLNQHKNSDDSYNKQFTF